MRKKQNVKVEEERGRIICNRFQFLNKGKECGKNWPRNGAIFRKCNKLNALEIQNEKKGGG
jgi:hypothetical protein